MDLGLSGRRAVITGGSQGIGLAIAHVLVAEGARVVIMARDEKLITDAVDEIQLSHPGSIAGFSADMTDPVAIAGAFDSAREVLGGIDVLVNNVGGASNWGDFNGLGDDDWVEAYELNVLSAVRAVRAVLPEMTEHGWGRIVNIVSESALQPDAFLPHYAASKAALLNLTKSLSRLTAGAGIRVNAVSPAFVMTPILARLIDTYAADHGVDPAEGERLFLENERPGITAGRAGQPVEVARMVAILCSSVADFIDGSNFRVDSGSVSTIS